MNEIIFLKAGMILGFWITWIVFACVILIKQSLSIKNLDKFLTETKNQQNYYEWKNRQEKYNLALIKTKGGK